MATEVRVKHTVNNIVSLLFFTTITSLMPFAIRACIIRVWGLEYLGLNSLFNSVLGVLNISELGIGQALVIKMYKPAAQGDTKTVGKLLALYRFFYKVLGITILIIGFVIVPFLSYIIKGAYPSDINIYVIYLIYLLQSVASYLFFPYCQAAFMANQDSGTPYRNHAWVWLFLYIIQIIAICFLHNYYAYIIWLPVGNAICGIIDSIVLKKRFPEYKLEAIDKNTFEKEYWLDFFKMVFAMALSKVRTVLRNSIDAIIVSATLGLVIVAKYQNYILVMTVPVMIAGSIIGGILPSLGNGVALESEDSNYAVTKIIAFVNQWVGTVFAAILACLYQSFMILWAGKDSTLSEFAMGLFVVYFYLRIISDLPNMVRNSSGVWWQGKWISVIESIVNLVFSFVLVKVIGVEGVIIATIISMLFINIPFENYYIFKYYFRRNPWRDLWTYLYQGIISFVIVFVTYSIAQLFKDTGIVSFIMKMLVGGTLSNLFLLVVYFRNAQFSELCKILKRFLSSVVNGKGK